ncbi:hypothetical protein CMO91_05695 [Candidatus Woesearchaeota archaeon]|mgnify:CR=1 FL=1|nr:hypothetical protein [Candidatus Woesearchaeota archaeon]
MIGPHTVPDAEQIRKDKQLLVGLTREYVGDKEAERLIYRFTNGDSIEQVFATQDEEGEVIEETNDLVRNLEAQRECASTYGEMGLVMDLCVLERYGIQGVSDMWKELCGDSR